MWTNPTSPRPENIRWYKFVVISCLLVVLSYLCPIKLVVHSTVRGKWNAALRSAPFLARVFLSCHKLMLAVSHRGVDLIGREASIEPNQLLQRAGRRAFQKNIRTKKGLFYILLLISRYEFHF